MICKNCGASLDPNAKFCFRCGAKTEEAQSGSFCPNCGAPVDGTMAFCRACGTRLNECSGPSAGGAQGIVPPVGEAAAGQKFYGPDAGGQPTSPGGGGPRPDSGTAAQKRVPLPAVLIPAVAVVLIAALLAAGFATGFFRRTFSSPEKYYAYVETSAMRDRVETLANFYDNWLSVCSDLEENGAHADLSVTSSDAVRYVLEGLGGAWWNDVSLSLDYQRSDSVTGVSAKAALDGVQLPTVNLMADLNQERLCLMVPELSDAALAMDLDDLSSWSGFYFDAAALLDGSAFQLSDYFANGRALQNFLMNYGDVLFGSVSNVTKFSDTVTVDGISQNCTLLEAKITEEDVANTLLALRDQLGDDADLQAVMQAFLEDFRALFPYSGVSEDRLNGVLGNLLTELGEIAWECSIDGDQNTYLLVQVWVDGSDHIVGRRISTVDYGDTTVYYEYEKPRSGQDYALYWQCGDGQEHLLVTGSGTESGSTLSGSFRVYDCCGIWQDEMVQAEITALDTQDLKNGFLDLDCTISPGEALVDGYDLLSLGSFALQVELSTSQDGVSAALTASLNGTELAGGKVGVTCRSQGTISLPSGVTAYDMTYGSEIESYLNTVDWGSVESLIRQLDLPSDFMEDVLDAIVDFLWYYVW